MREAHKRSRNPKAKKAYRVKNWHQYDKALRNRGDVTILFSAEATRAWAAKQTGKPGRQKKGSDLAVETVLTLRLVFRLPLRQAEGFVHSVLSLMDLQLPTPDYTAISRRSKTLRPSL